jgi:hypothetical protein
VAIHYFQHRVYTKTATKAVQVVAYLQREGEYAPNNIPQVDYLTRATNGRDDLRHTQLTYFPSWANDNASTFFKASQDYERKNGRWATALQCALPRELSREQQIALANDFVTHALKDHPSLTVLHAPVSKADGLEQPHIHILFSERTLDEHQRPPEQFFRQYIPKYPERGGAQKDRFFSERRSIDRLRCAWADLTNYHLELAGSEARIDPRSLKERKIDREAPPKTYPYQPFQAPALREEDKEHTLATQRWEQRKEDYDVSSDVPTQIAARMRSGSPGKHLSADVLRTQTLERLTALETYHTELTVAATRFQTRAYPDRPLRPTEQRDIDNLISKGVTVGLPPSQREVIHRGAQLSKQKGRGFDYEGI